MSSDALSVWEGDSESFHLQNILTKYLGKKWGGAAIIVESAGAKLRVCNGNGRTQCSCTLQRTTKQDVEFIAL